VTLNVDVPGFVAIARVMLSPEIGFAFASCRCATIGMFAPAAMLLDAAGCVVNVSDAGAPAMMLNEFPVVD
jgi:hypothetical protein